MCPNIALVSTAEVHKEIKGMHWRDESNTDSVGVAPRTRLIVIVSHFILIARIMELVSKDNVSCFIAFSSPTQLYIALSEPFLQWKAHSLQSSFHLNQISLFIYSKAKAQMGNPEVLIIAD